jgi:hypothetical protein
MRGVLPVIAAKAPWLARVMLDDPVGGSTSMPAALQKAGETKDCVAPLSSSARTLVSWTRRGTKMPCSWMWEVGVVTLPKWWLRSFPYSDALSGS